MISAKVKVNDINCLKICPLIAVASVSIYFFLREQLVFYVQRISAIVTFSNKYNEAVSFLNASNPVI